ncbi:MAG: site-specific integrase [Planctomycetota bacterium]
MTREEVNLLKWKTQNRSATGRRAPVRDWFVIDLALSTGLRVQEMADLCCSDLVIDNGHSEVVVRSGKGGKRGIVQFGSEFREHVRRYLDWKRSIVEDASPDAPIFRSSNTGGHMTKRALQKVFERCLKRAGIISHHSIHDCRHTFAVFLYKASKFNLRLVQKQLRHSSIRTTQVYANVFRDDLELAMEKLYR